MQHGIWKFLPTADGVELDCLMSVFEGFEVGMIFGL